MAVIVRRHALAVLGGLAALAVVAGAQPPTERVAGPAVHWPVLDVHSLPGVLQRAGPGLAVGGVIVLGACWLSLLAAARAGGLRVPQVLRTAVIWSAPLLIGPPVLSADVYSYTAQGQLGQAGYDPYRVGVHALGALPLVQSVDPRWQFTRTPYGPLAIGLDRAAAAGGHPAHAGGGLVVTVLLMRAVAVVGVGLGVWAVWTVSRGGGAGVAGPASPAWAVALVAANPLVLLQLVGAAHLDALLLGLLGLAVLVRARGRPLLAVLLATAAGMVKATAFVAVAAFVVADVAEALQGGRSAPVRATAVAARDLAGAAVVAVGCSLAVPDGFGWLSNLSTPGSATTMIAPASFVGAAVHAVLRTPASVTAHVLRLTAFGLASLAVILLLATARRRSAARTAGYALLAVTAGGPVLYPWYLAAPLGCLAPAARGRLGTALVVLSLGACAIALPSLGEVPADWLAGALGSAVLIAVGALTLLSPRRPTSPETTAVSAGLSSQLAGPAR